MSYDLPPELRVRSDGPLRTVVLNRPEQRNAINRPLHWALANVWRQLAADRDARVVILTGAGSAFSAGGDLEWVASFEHDPAGRHESIREAAEIIDEMLRFPLPVIAAVNGPAVGLGCSIAILSDVVLVAEDAYFSDPHVSVGLVAGDGGAALWPLLTNILRTREFLLTGERIPAARATEIGLASRTVPGGALMTEATTLADRLARQPAGALQGTKRILNMHLSRALSGAVAAGFAAEEATMQTPEHLERLEALRRAGA